MMTQKPPRYVYLGGSRCENRNDGASSPIEPIEKSDDLPVLPGADTVLTNKNSRRFYRFNLLSNGSVPEASGSDIRLIQPRFDILLG